MLCIIKSVEMGVRVLTTERVRHAGINKDTFVSKSSLNELTVPMAVVAYLSN